jgi:hypothetical protein
MAAPCTVHVYAKLPAAANVRVNVPVVCVMEFGPVAKVTLWPLPAFALQVHVTVAPAGTVTQLGENLLFDTSMSVDVLEHVVLFPPLLPPLLPVGLSLPPQASVPATIPIPTIFVIRIEPPQARFAM